MMYKLFRKAKTSDWSRKLQLKTGDESVDNVGARRGGFRWAGCLKNPFRLSQPPEPLALP